MDSHFYVNCMTINAPKMAIYGHVINIKLTVHVVKWGVLSKSTKNAAQDKKLEVSIVIQ